MSTIGSVQSANPSSWAKQFRKSGLSLELSRSRVLPSARRVPAPARCRGNLRCLSPVLLSKQIRISRVGDGVDVWGRFLIGPRWRGGTSAQANGGKDGDSTAAAGEKKDGKLGLKKAPAGGNDSKGDDKPVSSSRREKQGRRAWWRGRRWEWRPLIQTQEIGILLLQLGIVMFIMRLLRPGIPLPGSEPRVPTSHVSVPFSEFLSRINNNQVQKVEVDGVHIMFRLKSDAAAPEGDVDSRVRDTEALVRMVSPTKRIVYTTTRPSDIKTPYDKMLENDVEFGSPDKRSSGFFNSAMVRAFLQPFCLSY